MVKKITVNCSFSGVQKPVAFYIGDSALDKNPINFQTKWLSENRGGSVPKNLMESLDKIKKISDQHSIPFEELYDHVFKEMQAGKTLDQISISNQKKVNSFTKSQEILKTND